jgi:hypothetical protein
MIQAGLASFVSPLKQVASFNSDQKLTRIDSFPLNNLSEMKIFVGHAEVKKARFLSCCVIAKSLIDLKKYLYRLSGAQIYFCRQMTSQTPGSQYLRATSKGSIWLEQTS